MLHKIGAHHIVHNATFMGGAANFKPNDLYWNRVLSQTVAGTVKNVHTAKDLVLLMFMVSSVKHPIGRNQIFIQGCKNLCLKNREEEGVEVEGDVLRVKNIDISKLISLSKLTATFGHMFFRSDLDAVVTFIKLES